MKLRDIIQCLKTPKNTDLSIEDLMELDVVFETGGRFDIFDMELLSVYVDDGKINVYVG